jgi:stage II sporulation protein Q
MDENKHPNQPNAEKENHKGDPLAGKQGPKMKSRRIFAKRWMYPAIYLGAAALIIGLMYIKSQTGASPVTSNALDEGNVSTGTTTAAETFTWPVAQNTQSKVSLGFFPDKGTQQQQAAAVVFYDNGYYPHEGYDIKSTTGSAFAVTAAVSGKVSAVTNNPLYGQTVEVQSNGYTERYESLSNVKVKAGDTIQQGQVIGTSGTCEFEKSQGNHLYFAVYKDGQPVDPGTLLPKQQ